MDNFNTPTFPITKFRMVDGSLTARIRADLKLRSQIDAPNKFFIAGKTRTLIFEYERCRFRKVGSKRRRTYFYQSNEGFTAILEA